MTGNQTTKKELTKPNNTTLADDEQAGRFALRQLVLNFAKSDLNFKWHWSIGALEHWSLWHFFEHLSIGHLQERF